MRGWPREDCFSLSTRHQIPLFASFSPISWLISIMVDKLRLTKRAYLLMCIFFLCITQHTHTMYVHTNIHVLFFLVFSFFHSVHFTRALLQIHVVLSFLLFSRIFSDADYAMFYALLYELSRRVHKWTELGRINVQKKRARFEPFCFVCWPSMHHNVALKFSAICLPASQSIIKHSSPLWLSRLRSHSLASPPSHWRLSWCFSSILSNLPSTFYSRYSL